MYSGVGSCVKTWKLECNIDVGGYTKKPDKNNKKSKRLQRQREIRLINILIGLVSRVFANSPGVLTYSKMKLPTN